MMTTPDLFEDEAEGGAAQPIAPGAVLLRRLARPQQAALVTAVEQVLAEAPLRHMFTPGGLRMSVAMSNCGTLGWVSDASGYRYDPVDPESGRAWPSMPAVFADLARQAAAEAGFAGFEPDACLLNRYEPGTRLSLHQDRNERDYAAPIVSVSLGLPARFQFGGLRRGDKTERIALHDGDVLVWGGPARLRFHGVLPLQPGRHPLWGESRINLTFRRAG